MPRFETPQPIALDLKIAIANILLTATDRADTAVEVLPTDPSKPGDASAAAETRVDYANGTLTLRDRSPWRQFGWWDKNRSVDVRIDLPSGSRVACDVVLMGNVELAGPLGDCRVVTGLGRIDVEQARSAHLETGMGDVTAGRLTGSVRIKTATGGVRVDRLAGSTSIHNANGPIQVGDAAGKVDIHAANGRITVDRAHDSLLARSAAGDVQVGRVEGGAVTAHTGFGKVEIGIRDGVAAWLDLTTRFGHVHNDLDAACQPDGAQATVEVRARTEHGDISVHRVATTA